MRLYLGIDQSYTSTGIVLIDDKGELHSTITINTKKGGYKNNFLRAKDIADSIHSFVLDLEAKGHEVYIGIEGLPYGSVSNITRDLAGLQFLIVCSLPEESLDTVEVYTPSSVKKYATKSGKATKEEMFMALPDDVKDKVSKFPKTKGRYDITDAYWIARLRRESKYAEDNQH